MDWLLFSRFAVERFAPLILTLLLGLYLLLSPEQYRRRGSRWLGLYFLVAAVFHLGYFTVYSVNRPWGGIGYGLAALSAPGLAVLVRVAYLFPRSAFTKEGIVVSRAAFVLGCIAVAEYFTGAALSETGRSLVGYGALYRSRLVPLVDGLLLAWSIVVLLRKIPDYEKRSLHTRTRTMALRLFLPRSSGGRAARNFALLIFVELLNAAVISSQLYFRTISYSSLLVWMNTVFLLIYTFYIIVYIRYYGSVPQYFKLISSLVVFTLVLMLQSARLFFIYQQNGHDRLALERLELYEKMLSGQSPLPAAVNSDQLSELPAAFRPAYLVELKDGQWSALSGTIGDERSLALWPGIPGIAEQHNTLAAARSGFEWYPDKTRLVAYDGQGYFFHYQFRLEGRLYGAGFAARSWSIEQHALAVKLFSLFGGALFILLAGGPLLFIRLYSSPLSKLTERLYQSLGESPAAYSASRNQFLRLEKSIRRVQRKIESASKHDPGPPDDEAARLSDSMLRAVESTVQYLDDNYIHDISREGLAGRVNLSPGRLGKAFLQVTGCRISDYVTRKRIDAACRRLQQTDETVLSIALEVGFENLRTFNRTFQRETGQTPTEFRRSMVSG